MEEADPSFLSAENALMHLAQLRREALDGLAVREVLKQHHDLMKPRALINHLMAQMNMYSPKWFRTPDGGRLPMLAMHTPKGGEVRWGVLSAAHPEGGWVVSWWDSAQGQFVEEILVKLDRSYQFARLRFSSPFSFSKSATIKIVFGEVMSSKGKVFEMAAATMVVNILAIATSLYAMQVYDRVVPTGATGTLLALSIGIAVAIVFECSGKWVRSTLLNNLSDEVDRRLARTVYSRFLNIRLDQLPASVGSTASRMRGYESVRGIMLLAITSLLFDFPMALISLIVLFAIGQWLVIIPAVFFIIALIFGSYFYRQVQRWAQEATPAQHFKTGLVVESIEGAETIKSGQGGWRMLTRWLDVSDEVRDLDRNMRDVSDHSVYIVTMFQQLSYISLIAAGALQVSSGNLSFGGLIACSLLSGRVFAPVAMLPKLLVQWGSTKAAVVDLDAMWSLEQDIPDGVKPVLLDNIHGNFNLKDVVANYSTNTVLNIDRLSIKSGEKVAIIGSIGSGKTTLLRILSGMYKPHQGRIVLDGVDIEQISKTSLAQHMGFVPQDGRLFAGTLRDNLLLGLKDPGDAKILEAATTTGLLETVIEPHPQGLSRVIYEGGVGLSGGQRQLVHVTRAVLRNPNIWLLDEPTASMDIALEEKVLRALHKSLSENDNTTLLLVTHKMQLVKLVDRLIVLGQERILLDGPRDAVLEKLNPSKNKAEGQ